MLTRTQVAVFISSMFLSSLVSAQNLADFHSDQLDLKCKDCHTAGMKVEDTEHHENLACIDCHGDYQDEKHTGKLSPHHSHLVEVSCTSCHAAHTQPVMICQTCHENFKTEFTMPFAGDAVISDLYVYPSYTQEDIQKAIAKGPVAKHKLVIIGAGAAGHAAAVSAKQHGIDDVVVLEKQPYIGGNGMLAAGGMAAAESLPQSFNQYKDSEQLWYDDTMKAGHNRNNPELLRTLVEQGSSGIDWLQSLGADMSSAAAAGGHSAERLHRPAGGAKSGPEIMKTLNDAAKKLNVNIMTNNKVLELVQDDTGRVTGVVVQGKHSGIRVIAADSVIIASGGFAANNEMVAKYRPDLKGVSATNNPGNVGDGLIFAGNIGAALVDVDQIQAFPTAADGKMVISGTARGAGAIMFNRQGERFCDEMGPRDKVSEAIWAQEGKDAWLVFDETVFERLGQLRGMLELGIVMQGDSAQSLAKATGMDAANIDKHVKRYNEFQKQGKDDDFGRQNMADDLQYPIYAVKVKPAIHHTMGGIVINSQTQVIDTKGKVIPGLFAAGEVTGGVHGGNRLAGNAIADTIVFGRIAGKSATQFINK